MCINFNHNNIILGLKTFFNSTICLIYYSQTSWICKDMSKPHSLSKDKHICANYTQMEWAFDICEDWQVC